mgnify:CR=1 FL=1
MSKGMTDEQMPRTYSLDCIKKLATEAASTGNVKLEPRQQEGCVSQPFWWFNHQVIAIVAGFGAALATNNFSALSSENLPEVKTSDFKSSKLSKLESQQNGKRLAKLSGNNISSENNRLLDKNSRKLRSNPVLSKKLTDSPYIKNNSKYNIKSPAKSRKTISGTARTPPNTPETSRTSTPKVDQTSSRSIDQELSF